jgi:C4-dicarboxylate-specific signal transduction histidine kinase
MKNQANDPTISMTSVNDIRYGVHTEGLNERASEVISRVRALLRREEGPQRSVDVNELCRASARLLRHDALTRRAEIILTLDPGSPAVIGDSVQLQQVVMNLVLNALDASMSAPSPRVEISTVAGEADVEIAVHDNGPGVPAELQRHLFESFFTTKAHGLGLGLVIVRSILERHSGRVRAENGKTGGAVFRVELARAPHARSGPAEMRPREEVGVRA